MEIIQTIVYIGLIYRTNEPCPQVHLHLLTNKVLRIKIETEHDSIVDVFSFQKDLIWPGRVRVQNNGQVEIIFNKMVHEDWSKPYATRVDNMTTVPEQWEVQVINNEPLTHDTMLISLTTTSKVFNFIYPGQFLQAINYLEGERRSYSFMTIPMFPLRSLEYPNPGPESYRSTSSSIYLATKAFPERSLSSFIASRKLGSHMHVSNPMPGFCPVKYDDAQQAIFYTVGSSVRNALGLMLWFLQTNRNVTLLAFYRTEQDMLWHQELKSMVQLTDRRLWYASILSHGSRLWRGKRGRPHYRWLNRYVRLWNETKETNSVAFIAGQSSDFLNITKQQFLTTQLYPEDRVFLITFNNVSREVPEPLLEFQRDIYNPDIL